LIAGNHGDHEGLGIGNNSDPQGDSASSEPDVEHSMDSRLERFKLCGMTTVFDVVGHSYRLHQATCFDCMYDRTGEMTLVAVCNTEYERFCEVGAIWFVHKHRM
jgi:hypothetical protein